MSDADREEDGDAGSAEEESAIVVVEPDASLRNSAEDLEDDFERQVIAMDSTEFDTEAAEEVIEAGVYIFNWNLGIRSAADLLEEVRHDPRLRDKMVIVAMEEPTAARVRTAMKLGADAICTLPYSGEEIAIRFDMIKARRQAA